MTLLSIIITSIILMFIFIAYKNEKTKNNHIEIITRQAARWAVAAEQDESPLISLLHANYAAGYLWALRDIATDDEIYNKSGIDITIFKNKIMNVQETATKKVSDVCPQFVGKLDKYLLSLAGDV